MRDGRVRSFFLLLLLSGAAARGGESPPKIEISYWTQPWDMRTMSEVFEKYERDHPNIKIVTGQAAARNLVDDPQRVLCSIVGGDPPDIIYFDRYAVGEWAARGAFCELDEFLKADRESGKPDAILPANYYVPCWEEAMYKGKVYGIPVGTDDRALYYNKDMLRKKGLVDEKGEARPPKDWKELYEYSVKLSEFEEVNGKKRLKLAGFIPNFGNSWLYIYGWQNHAKFMSDDGTKCLLNAPEVVEALTYMKSIYEALGGAAEVDALQAGFQVGGEQDAFILNKVAMKIDGNWSLPQIASYRQDMNFGIAPAPMKNAAEQPISWLGGFAWVIPRGAKHPKEAWELIRTMASLETARHNAEIERRSEASQGRDFIPRLSANKIITEALYKEYLVDNPNADPKFVSSLKIFIDLLPHCKYRPVTPVGMVLWTQHVRATEKAIFAKPGDGMTPQRALDEGAAIVQRELDRIVVPETGAVVEWSFIAKLYFGLLGIGVLAGLIWFYTKFAGGPQTRAEAWAGWGFASPWMAGFIVFTGGPILCSLVMSFCSYDAMSPSHFIGLRNFQELFTSDDVFMQSLRNTGYMLIRVPLNMVFGLGVAMMLSQNVRFMGTYRTFFYLPVIVPGVASAILWTYIFNAKSGILNAGLEALGIHGPGWISDRNWSKPALLLQGLWGAGAGMIVWLAGLRAIPEDLYEAAAIDGANAFKRFRHITLPMLTPYIFFNMVMGIIDTLKIFDPAYLITKGGPADSTLFYAYNLFNHAFRYLHMGYASALAWVLFLLVFALTMLQLKMSKRWVHYQGD